MSNIKHVIKEREPDSTDFRFFFEDDGLKSEAHFLSKETQYAEYNGKKYPLNDYNCNLFIIGGRNNGNFNAEEYDTLCKAMESLDDAFQNVNTENPSDSEYKNYSEAWKWQFSTDEKPSTKLIHNLKKFFGKYNINGNYHKPQNVARFLSIVRSETWKVIDAHGYCQGDYVQVLYCADPGRYENAKIYGELWLGAGKEFAVIDLDENGIITDTCGGYFIADCQAYQDEKYKALVCEYACIDPEETELQLIDTCRTVQVYTWRTV